MRDRIQFNRRSVLGVLATSVLGGVAAAPSSARATAAEEEVSLPDHSVAAIYLNGFTESLSAVPPDADEVRISSAATGHHATGPYGRLRWPDGVSVPTAAELTSWKKARPGRRVSISLGGAGYLVDLADTTQRADDLAALARQIGGIDSWDLDAEYVDGKDPAVVHKEVTAFAEAVSTGLGVGVTLTPSGKDVTAATDGSGSFDYLALARAMMAKESGNTKLLLQYSQQFYDTPESINWNAVSDRLDQAIQAGIPASRLSLGMAIKATESVGGWTMAQCIEMSRRARAEHQVTGATLWSAGSEESATWAHNMLTIATR